MERVWSLSSIVVVVVAVAVVSSSSSSSNNNKFHTNMACHVLGPELANYCVNFFRKSGLMCCKTETSANKAK